MPAHDRDDAWSDPAPVSGAGASIEPASHRARADGRAGRHAWTRDSGEWRQRERTGEWTGPKHASGEWPTLHLDAQRDSADWNEARTEVFSSPEEWTPPRPAEPRWTAQDWTVADQSVRRPGAQRRIEWLDGPDGDDAARSHWKAVGPGSRTCPTRSPTPDAGGEPRSVDKTKRGQEEGHDGWTDEEWFRLGDAPTEELFTRRAMPRSHRRPEPLRKATLRVLAAVLVAGGGVGLTMNLTSGDGGNPGAPARVEDRALQRVDGPVMPVPSASATPTDAQTDRRRPTRRPSRRWRRPRPGKRPRSRRPPRSRPRHRRAVAPAPAPTTPVPTTPVPTTPPPTTDPTPTPTPEPSASPAPREQRAGVEPAHPLIG